MRTAFCLATLGILTMQGCTFARIAMRNVTPSFQTPRPVQKLDRSDVPPATRLSATWIGHSTVLLQMDDAFILTDPVLTPRVGKVSKRLVEPGMDLDKIPSLNLVLISHRHFDHLSPESLKLLGSRVHTILTPPGVRADLSRTPYAITELAVWQSFSEKGLEVTAVPTIHDGGRTLHDLKTHPFSFTGFRLRYHGLSVYYPGDTAFRPDIFNEVYQRFGPVDLAILPIGPIEPTSLMQKTHMNPAQAVEAAELLHAGTMLPVHFETFVNSLDGRTEDRDALVRAEQSASGSVKYVNWHIGQSAVIK